MCACATEKERLYSIHTCENSSTQEAGHMAEREVASFDVREAREEEEEEKVEEEKMDRNIFLHHSLSVCK